MTLLPRLEAGRFAEVRDDFLSQARRDAAIVATYSPVKRARLEAETDWLGYRIRAYQ